MSKSVVKVGIDVGASELWVAVPGRRPKSFAHSPAGIQMLHRWVCRLTGGNAVHYCLEATGVYSVHAATRLLSFSEVTISIVNPAVIAAFARTTMKRSKTDAIDAELIRRYAEQHQPRAWHPEPEPLRQLAALVAQTDTLKAILQQWDNHSHVQQFTPDLPAAVQKTQRSVHRSLQRQLDTIERTIDHFCATDPHLAHQIALLETIPGIARRAATQLLAYGGSRWMRYSARAMTAQAGLAPRHHTSGTSIAKKQRIDRQGDRRLRRALYMPALVGTRYNPALKKLYGRLCANGKLKKVALVACMRKLLTIVRAILNNKKPFQKTLQQLT